MSGVVVLGLGSLVVVFLPQLGVVSSIRPQAFFGDWYCSGIW